MVAGQKTGTVRFVGRTQFASGWVLWIALEEKISYLPISIEDYTETRPFFLRLGKPDRLVNSHHPDDKLVNLLSLKVMFQKPAKL